MKYLLRFHIKQIINSPFFWIIFVVTGLGLGAFLFLLSGSSDFINYVTEYNAFTYFEPIIIIVSYGFAVYYLKQETTLEVICLYTKAEVYIGKTLAIMLDSLILCAYPVLFIAISAIQQRTGLLFTMTALLHMCLLWVMMILASQSAAAIICLCIKDSIAYILCIPVTILLSFMNSFILQPVLGNRASRLSAFFSMQKPFVYGANVEYAGANMDLFHLSKFLYVIIGTAVILSFVWLLLSQVKKKAVVFFSAVSILEICCILLWLWSFPQTFDADKKLFVKTDVLPNSEIIGYSGNIGLGEFCSVKCTIDFAPYEQKQVTFRLDQCFNIRSIQTKEKEIPFERNGDYITLALPENGKEEMQINFEYTGRVYYVSNVDVISLYASRYSAALPARFALLPILDGDLSDKQYNLTVTAHNTLVSNLDVTPIGSNTYHVYGNANTCSFFVGYIEEYEEDSIIFYHAKYNRLTDYKALYIDILDRKRLDAFTGSISEINYPQPKKVFLLYSHYKNTGFPVQYDNYILTIGSKLF